MVVFLPLDKNAIIINRLLPEDRTGVHGTVLPVLDELGMRGIPAVIPNYSSMNMCQRC